MLNLLFYFASLLIKDSRVECLKQGRSTANLFTPYIMSDSWFPVYAFFFGIAQNVRKPEEVSYYRFADKEKKR